MAIDTARALRKAMFNCNEMSPSELCKRYGCGKANISNMRTDGVKNLDIIEKLCGILNIEVSEFIKLGEGDE